jgi:hypothetical protein
MRHENKLWVKEPAMNERKIDLCHKNTNLTMQNVIEIGFRLLTLPRFASLAIFELASKIHMIPHPGFISLSTHLHGVAVVLCTASCRNAVD